LEEYKKALADWDRLLAVAAPTEADGYRFWRGMTLAYLGDHRQAAADVERSLRRPAVSTNERYLCVCVLSYVVEAALGDAKLSSEEREKAADRYAARALDVLEQLRRGGFFSKPGDWKKVDEEPNLGALRTRDAFKRWRQNAAKR
jgi:hypothetical protein